MAVLSVSRVVVRERRSIEKMFDRGALRQAHDDLLSIGEKRGEKVMPGKLPTTSRCPVSIFSR